MKQFYFSLLVCFVVSNIAEAQNVGIGTSTPSARLHVQTPNLAINEASFRVQPLGGDNSNTSHFSLIDMWSTFDNYSADQIPRRTASLKAGYSGGTWGNEYLSFRVGGSNDAAIEPTERMRILANGNVIINSLGTGYVKASSGTLSSSATVPWSDISGAPAFLTSYTETDPQVGANTTNYVPRWNGSELVSGVIQDNGTNVGISTAPSTYKLDVAGSVRLQDYGSAGSVNILIGDDTYLTDVDRADILGLYSASNNAVGGLQLGSNTGSYLFGSGGNVGIGTTAPSNKLHVGASEGQGIDIGLPNDAMGFNGGSTSIRFYGYRDVVSNAIGAKISAERTDRCCGWLSQGTELVFYTNAGLTTSNADNSIERVRITDNGILQAKAGFQTNKKYTYYRGRANEDNAYTFNIGFHDICYLGGVSFYMDNNVTWDLDNQCNVYPTDWNSGVWGDGGNQGQLYTTGPITKAYNVKPEWRLYVESFIDNDAVYCGAICIDFD